MSDYPKMIASNTADCFRSTVGETVRGVLFDALPLGRRDLACGTKTLIFEGGWGLTISSNGSYWLETKEAITRAVSIQEKRLAALERETRDVLALAGRDDG